MPYIRVDFDLADYEDEIIQEYCNHNCLKNEKKGQLQKIKEYVKDMYKTLYLTIDNSRDIKTMEQIYNDLDNILNS